MLSIQNYVIPNILIMKLSTTREVYLLTNVNNSYKFCNDLEQNIIFTFQTNSNYKSGYLEVNMRADMCKINLTHQLNIIRIQSRLDNKIGVL